MGQMSAVRQRHAENGVARFKHRHVHRLIGLRTGMRLHVGILGTKQSFQPINRQLFSHVYVLTSTVITFSGITLGVFIGELATLRFHHCRAGVIFRGDQLNVIFLT